MTEIIDLKKATQTAKESLARTADNSTAQILRAIEIIEESLREKRSRIEEIEMRRDHLASEYRKLNETLEWENNDLAKKLNAVINDLGTDGAILELLSDMP
jgi:predicted nuclease with TOPRIM domain